LTTEVDAIFRGVSAKKNKGNCLKKIRNFPGKNNPSSIGIFGAFFVIQCVIFSSNEHSNSQHFGGDVGSGLGIKGSGVGVNCSGAQESYYSFAN